MRTAAVTRVLRREGADGAWELTLRPPDARLRGLVADYAGFVESAWAPVARREVPTARVPVILHLGAPYEVATAGGAPAAYEAGFAAGLHDVFAETVSPRGGTECLQVDLTPTAAHRVFRVGMTELANRVVDLRELLGPSADELLGRLRDARTWEARFALVDAFLLRRLAAAPAGSREVTWAWHTLRRSRGALPIGALAEELGWSHRHLIARFRAEIGLPPKTVARVMRFERALELARSAPSASWADIAHAAGYADQAHLIRDFRGFAGVTPGAFPLGTALR